MINRVNSCFAVLARQSYGVYIILGVVISFLFMYFVEREAQIHILKKLKYPALFIIIAQAFLLQSFYGRHERGGKKVPLTRYGHVIKDDYFLEKITSNISAIKKTLGYLYVIFTIASSGIIGFLMGFALSMFLKKGY